MQKLPELLALRGFQGYGRKQEREEYKGKKSSFLSLTQWQLLATSRVPSTVQKKAVVRGLGAWPHRSQRLLVLPWLLTHSPKATCGWMVTSWGFVVAFRNPIVMWSIYI